MMNRKSIKMHTGEHFYLSSRGLHLCFATVEAARNAYNDFSGSGNEPALLLERTEVIDTRLEDHTEKS